MLRLYSRLVRMLETEGAISAWAETVRVCSSLRLNFNVEQRNDLSNEEKYIHCKSMFVTSVLIAGFTVPLMFFQRNFHLQVAKAKALDKLVVYIICQFFGVILIFVQSIHCNCCGVYLESNTRTPLSLVQKIIRYNKTNHTRSSLTCTS